LFGCQQVLIKTGRDTQAIIEYLCYESNNLYNCAVYYGRQIWFKTHRIVTGFDLAAQMKTNRHFNAGYASSMQHTCINVGEAFKRWLRLNNGLIRFPLGKQVNAWFGIREFFLPMPTNLDWSIVKEVRLLPRNGCFYAEFVYSNEIIEAQLDTSNVLGIDPGLNNWLTVVSNVGTSFIVDGKHLKSLNQWYNKQISTMKDRKPQGFWSRTLANITEKRNRQMRDAVNKAARIVINHCLENNIGTIVFGWNKGQKDSINLGSKTNQKFVSVPTAKLKTRIVQLCEQYGIRFEETEESYTSKSSYLDNDELPKYGEKPKEWKPSGKRVERGLYRTANFGYVNADCNGAANILRKVKGKLGLDLGRLTRGILTMPIRVRLWPNSVQESLSEAVL
jgi:putative transposase